jgi:hypothetical protein
MKQIKATIKFDGKKKYTKREFVRLLNHELKVVKEEMLAIWESQKSKD